MKNLALKLLAIQKKIKPIEKSETNPFYKSKYFDVNAVINEIRPLLNKHGLVVIQSLTDNGYESPALKTTIIDSESGESLSSRTPLPNNPDPQKMGAIITYFRRYSLVCLFLLEGEEDDDANSAQPEPTVPVEPFTAKKCKNCGNAFTPKFAKATTCYQCFSLGMKATKEDNSKEPF